MSKIKAPRGTQDILPEASELWQEIEYEALSSLQEAGFKEIRTPIFEDTALFNRAVGADSDIVNKEMYTFSDRSDRSLTLRPEGTASIVRSYIENALDRNITKTCKLWYRGPMFRYERPQAGRYRQFHQIGAEAFGSKAPYIDIELIHLGMQMLENLGLENLTLHINSIGSAQSRLKYREKLKEFLAPLQGDVCEDCQRRFEQNPLRALDCKVPEDQALYKDAPSIYDSFDDESKEIWDQLRAGLTKLNISFVEDPKLVRGLDYYTHTVFEIKTDNPMLGQQSTVLAGGRYDALVSSLGGPEMPAVGWALGIERIALLLEEKRKAEETSKYFDNKIFIVSDSNLDAQQLAIQLRAELPLFCVDLDFDNAKIKKQMEKADKKSCRYVIFYMEDERNSGRFKIKDLSNGEEIAGIDYEAVIDFVTAAQLIG